MRKPYRDGRVHVCAWECDTCIFKPGNVMHLQPGRVRKMIDDAKRDESAIVCHETYGGDRAICRGFYERHPTAPLQIAERLGLVTEVEPG